MSTTEAPHGLKSSAWRFVLAGGANTIVTGALLATLSLVIDTRLAYTLVFAVGIALSTFLADRFVFGVRLNRPAVAIYVAMYLAVYVIGLAVVAQIGNAGLPHSASGLVVLVTAPLTFLGGRLIAVAVHRNRIATPTRQVP